MIEAILSHLREIDHPRGWLQNPRLNLRNDHLRFAQAMQTRFKDIIRHCKSIDAQGVVIWDLEGGGFPSASYLGEPRRRWMLPRTRFSSGCMMRG